MPGFHAFTGCDYTAAFVRKGEKWPFALLDKMTAGLAHVTSEEILDKDSEKSLEKYTCGMYGAHEPMHINDYRYHMFEEIGLLAKKTSKSLHPAWRELMPAVFHRVKVSSNRNCEELDLCPVCGTDYRACDQVFVKHPKCGCKLSDRSYTLVWFVGPHRCQILDPDGGSTDVSNSDSENPHSDVEYDVNSDF